MRCAILQINRKRFENMIERFADFGRTENNGVTRLAFSEEDIKVRQHFEQVCNKLNMTVTHDDVGNMYAKLPGADNDLPPIVIGSHLDSVEKGGRFDGVLGVLTGLEVVQTMKDNDIKPQMPIVIANITNEEGARFEPAMMASGIISGKFDKTTMSQSKDPNGTTFGEALQASGYAGKKENRLQQAKAFLELHIEQGPVLETENVQIGVVEGVMGMVNYEVEVTGDSNHAGTTPMHLRQDALFATNDVINELRKKLNQLDSTLVYTIGRMDVTPNIHTVIPNKVVFTVEARHEKEKVIQQVEETILQLPDAVNNHGCEINLHKQWDRNTVWFNQDLVNKVEASAEKCGFSNKRMVSGAGHDSQFISTYLPAAMIFVPSVNGKSHSEDELTYWEDCENGANVMLQTVINILDSPE